MDRWEAARLLQEGKKVRKKSWPKDDYIFLDKYAGLMDRAGRLVPETIFADISEFWEEYGESMTFGEAMVALEQGKRVRAKVWDSNRFIYKSDKNTLIDDSGKLFYLDLQKLMDEEWEEYSWEEMGKKARVVYQVRCPHCFTYSCREISDIHYIYCPHCGAKVVK